MKKLWISVLAMVPFLAFGMDLVSGDYVDIFVAKSEKTVVWNVTSNPNVYVVDLPNLTLQGRMFNRVTQLIEQVRAGNGYPHAMDNQEMTAYIESLRRTVANLGIGHDFQVNDLVLFYNLVDRDKLEIYPEEIELRDFLVNQGMVRVWRGFYQALRPGAVILSIPQVQERRTDEPAISEFTRRAVLTHEIAHAEFFTNTRYADYCRKFWAEGLKAPQQTAFLEFLKKYNYEVSLADLVVNEMQAYLMFTPDAQSFSAAKLGVSEDELAALRRAFRAGNPPTKLTLQAANGGN
jgi:hypothetical protein